MLSSAFCYRGKRKHRQEKRMFRAMLIMQKPQATSLIDEIENYKGGNKHAANSG